MNDNTSNADQKKATPKRSRQWSIMIVGTHGRVIPLRRFMPIAVAVSILAALGIVAIAGLSILYVRQVKQVHELLARVEVLNNKAEDLRNERDVYLAKVVIMQEQVDGLSTPQPVTVDKKEGIAGDGAEDVKAGDDRVGGTLSDGDEAKKAPEKKAAVVVPPVTWGATIKQFSVNYYPEEKRIRVRFRVYNTSSPKKKLSGRCVVILKQKDDPPVRWLSLPGVLLTDGKPSSDTGYAFRINNYRTITLTAIDQKAPVEFNTASIYIFHADGTQLYLQDHPFFIEQTPPPQSAPKAPAQEKIQSNEAPQHDELTQQRNEEAPQVSDSLDAASGPENLTKTDPLDSETSTDDPPAADETIGPKLEGEKQ